MQRGKRGQLEARLLMSMSPVPIRERKGNMNMFRIDRMAQHGNLRVYRRAWREPGLKRFLVYDSKREVSVAEFDRRKSATQYAIDNCYLFN